MIRLLNTATISVATAGNPTKIQCEYRASCVEIRVAEDGQSAIVTMIQLFRHDLDATLQENPLLVGRVHVTGKVQLTDAVAGNGVTWTLSGSDFCIDINPFRGEAIFRDPTVDLPLNTPKSRAQLVRNIKMLTLSAIINERCANEATGTAQKMYRMNAEHMRIALESIRSEVRRQGGAV